MVNDPSVVGVLNEPEKIFNQKCLNSLKKIPQRKYYSAHPMIKIFV